MPFANHPWNRPAKIIIGIDIGTTSSSVTFAYLSPGVPQSLHRVTAWPGPESRRTQSSIPTAVWYDVHNNAVSFGAEALTLETEQTAEEEGWRSVRHFKLQLYPEAMLQRWGLTLNPLPVGLSLLQVYADFMGFLLAHTEEFFESRMVDGKRVWEDHRQNATIVLTHPNGWGPEEHEFLRKAAVAAKIVPPEKAAAQIQFVTEAETSLYLHSLQDEFLEGLSANANIIICDAGGSFINTTACCVRSTSPVLEISEMRDSACRPELYLSTWSLVGILQQPGQLSRDECADYVENAVKDFSEAKNTFESVDRGLRIKFGPAHLTIPCLGVRRGTIALDGATVAMFFDPHVNLIVTSIRQQMSGLSCEHMLLMGQFADSLYLRKVFTTEFSKECTIRFVNDWTAAAADGAVIWCARHFVAGRTTQLAYGVEINEVYDPKNSEHFGRTVHRHDAGYNFVIGKWSQIIGKGAVIGAQESIRRPYWRSYKTTTPHLNKFKLTIFAFTGDSESPNEWLRDKQGRINKGFKKICEVESDLTVMRQALRKKTAQDGDYWYLDFTVALQFGGTDLQAFVEWEQNGEICTGLASVIPSTLANTWS